MLKTCTKCGTEYPATAEFFDKQKTVKCGLKSQCKKCSAKYEKNYRQTFNGKLRRIFESMKQRCNNPKNNRYHCYGGRGIQCNFVSANDFIYYVKNVLGITKLNQIKNLQIDRIDNNKHYERNNVRFVTAKENANNRRNSKRKEVL